MPTRIRPARPDDAPALLEVKRALRLTGTAPQRGGFLLGTTLEGYRAFIERDLVLVAEDTSVVGFAIVLGHDTLTRSDLWARAAQADLAVPAEAVLARGRVAYVEQLAMLPGFEHRVYAKYLAFQALRDAFGRHATVFTTVVREPIPNAAVLPFLEVTGFERVGRIEETYPEVGRVLSDIHALTLEAFAARLERADFRAFVRKGERDGYLRAETGRAAVEGGLAEGTGAAP